MQTRLTTLAGAVAVIALGAGAAPIDREALVARHRVVRTDAQTRNPLQVGNGEFAFGADVTGLQTFHGNTFAQWGWHTLPLPAGLRVEDFKLKPYDTYGRPVGYATDAAGQEALYDWLRQNPHRLNLGRLALAVRKHDGTALKPADLADIRQELDPWRGLLTSRYTLEGRPVVVTTCADPARDAVAVRIESPLAAEGRLAVALAFPYGNPTNIDGANWSQPGAHTTRLTTPGAGRADFGRRLDADRYGVALA